MIFGLFRGRKWAESARSVYQALVEQSRQPTFYTDLGVPDTVDGRFDMICVHAFLVIRRLQAEPGDGPELAQGVFDAMFRDMDRNLREMGVGDLSVGKHVKGMAKAYYGRAAAYEAGLAAEDASVLDAALRRNLYRKTDPAAWQVRAVADYMRREARRLEDRTFRDLAAAHIGFAVPDVPIPAEATARSPRPGDAAGDGAAKVTEG